MYLEERKDGGPIWHQEICPSRAWRDSSIKDCSQFTKTLSPQIKQSLRAATLPSYLCVPPSASEWCWTLSRWYLLNEKTLIKDPAPPRSIKLIHVLLLLLSYFILKIFKHIKLGPPFQSLSLDSIPTVCFGTLQTGTKQKNEKTTFTAKC